MIKTLLSLLLLPLLLFAVTPKEKLQPITLQLNWKYQFEFAGYIAAKEKGFYKQVALDVSIKEFNTSINIIDNIVDGTVDFTLYDDDIAFVADQKKPIIWLQNYLKRPALALVVKPNIFTPADLVGKKIMSSKDELTTGSIGLMLKKFNLDAKNYTHVNTTYTIEPFVNGEIDAMSVYLSNELYELQHRNISYNLLDPSAYNIHSLGGNLFTSKKMLKNSEELVQRFMYATIEGWSYALKHKQEIIHTIYEKYSQRKSIAALEYEADVIEKLIMPNFYPLGSIEIDKVYKNANYLTQAGLIKSSENLSDYIYQSKTSTIFTKEELNYLAQKREIKMCIDPNWMPFEKIEKDEHIGMTSDYFRLLSKNIGIPIIHVKSQNWNESIALAKNRECDIFSLAMETPERKEYMNFTSSYISMPLVVATKLDKLFINDVAELIDKKIGVVNGYAYGEILRKRYPNMQLINVKNVNEGLQKVVTDELYGFTDSLATVSYEIQQRFPGELKIAGKFNEKFELAIGTRNDEVLLLSIFEKAISLLTQKEHQKILNHWISVNYDKAKDYTLIWKIVGLALLISIILATIIAWQGRQHRLLSSANTKINQSLDSFITLFNATIEGVVITKDGLVVEANSSLCKMLQYSKDEIIGKDPLFFAAPEYKEFLIEKIQNAGNDYYEIDVVNKNGECVPVSINGQDSFFKGDKVRIVTVLNLTEQKKQQVKLETINQKLNEMATHDQLTGLANRHLFESQLQQEI